MEEKEFEMYYFTKYHQYTLDNRMVLYETKEGACFSDSPLAMFRYWSKTYPTYQHVVIIQKEFIEKVSNCFREEPIKIVEKFSNEHLEAILKAKFVVTDSMIFTSYFTKRKGQIFINTWHGTPYKRMGYAMPGGVLDSWNVIRNFIMTDYLLAPNQHTETVFRRDYRLNGLYDGEILRLGYPRNDVLVNGLSKLKAAELRRKLNLSLDKSFILYAPTWSGNVIMGLDSKIVLKYLDVINYVLALGYEIRLKVHPYMEKLVSSVPELQPYLVSDDLVINDVLCIVDTLITDYSSIFFDFLLRNKSIIFLDLFENYQKERGFYMKQSCLPGPFLTQVSQLSHYLNRDEYVDKRKIFKRLFLIEETGKSAQLIVEKIIKSGQMTWFERFKMTTTKKKLQVLRPKRTLIYAGDFLDEKGSQQVLNYLQKKSGKQDISILVKFPGDIHEFWQHVDEIISPESIAPTYWTRLFIVLDEYGNKQDIILDYFKSKKVMNFFKKDKNDMTLKQILGTQKFDKYITFIE